jgi:DNA-binding winged helix-turn-helix (wHTH) protein
LRKNGVRIKIQEQPFRVLVELVANAGRVVAREGLQQKLWPADTFVDFDVGLNNAIRKLRQSLGDDADEPRYIETLARRGYRFVAPVVVAASAPSGAPVGDQRPPDSIPKPAFEQALRPVKEIKADTHLPLLLSFPKSPC